MKMRPLLPILVLGFACGGEGVDIVDRGESHFIVYGFAGGGVLNPFDHLILRGAIHVPDCRSEPLALVGPYEVSGPYRQGIIFSPAVSERVCAELVYGPPISSEVPAETVQVETMAVPITEAPDSVRVDVVLTSQG